MKGCTFLSSHETQRRSIKVILVTFWSKMNLQSNKSGWKPDTSTCTPPRSGFTYQGKHWAEPRRSDANWQNERQSANTQGGELHSWAVSQAACKFLRLSYEASNQFIAAQGPTVKHPHHITAIKLHRQITGGFITETACPVSPTSYLRYLTNNIPLFWWHTFRASSRDLTRQSGQFISTFLILWVSRCKTSRWEQEVVDCTRRRADDTFEFGLHIPVIQTCTPAKAADLGLWSPLPSIDGFRFPTDDAVL